MSKLYNKYLSLKSKYPNQALLFNNGLFYIFLDEDAKCISEKLNLKLTKLNDDISKCGFPSSTISKYTKLLEHNEIAFKIIENDFTIINDNCNYVNNTVISNFIEFINNLDFDEVSPLKALNILIDFKKNLGNIGNA